MGVLLFPSGSDAAMLNLVSTSDELFRIARQMSPTYSRHSGHCFFAAIDSLTSKTASQSATQKGSGGCLHRLLCTGLTAYDLLGIGLMVCNADCHVLGANQTAISILRANDGLSLNTKGVLSTTQENSQPTGLVLQEVVLRALSGRNGNTLLIRRSADKPAFTVIVRAAGGKTGAEPADPSLALVLILDPSLPRETKSADLQQLYGLTQGETRVANLLMEGTSLDECCNQLAICRSTGRSHLRRLFKKTGVHRQSQLVALLLRSIGLVRQRRRSEVVEQMPEPKS